MPTIEDVYTELRHVYDPEIPVNIVDLGLIYDVRLDKAVCMVKMTLTSRGCPEALSIPEVVRKRVSALEGIEACDVQVVWDPMWSPQRISATGRRALGLPEEPEP
jgi:metal-sulfur cluster biosynthetic enzyme